MNDSSSELNLTPNNILKSRLTDETYTLKYVLNSSFFFVFIGKRHVNHQGNSLLFREIIDAHCRSQEFQSSDKNSISL